MRRPPRQWLGWVGGVRGAFSEARVKELECVAQGEERPDPKQGADTSHVFSDGNAQPPLRVRWAGERPGGGEAWGLRLLRGRGRRWSAPGGCWRPLSGASRASGSPRLARGPHRGPRGASPTPGRWRQRVPGQVTSLALRMPGRRTDVSAIRPPGRVPRQGLPWTVQPPTVSKETGKFYSASRQMLCCGI